MEKSVFETFSDEFARQGHRIRKVRAGGGDVYFDVLPFTASYFGWVKSVLSHVTLYDDLPLVEISEQDILARRALLADAVGEAVAAARREDEQVGALKRKSLAVRAGGRMEWL